EDYSRAARSAAVRNARYRKPGEAKRALVDELRVGAVPARMPCGREPFPRVRAEGFDRPSAFSEKPDLAKFPHLEFGYRFAVAGEHRLERLFVLELRLLVD